MKKKKILIISSMVALIGILLILGGTYALFNYYKKGTIENAVTTGKITFRYDETSVRGIDLQNALPILDRDGTSLSGDGEYFDFTVSTQGTNSVLGYQVEVELTEDSSLDPSIVKISLTQIEDDNEIIVGYLKDGKISVYSDLQDNTDKTAKIIYYDYFNGFNTPLENKYRLRIWIDKEADFSPLTNEDGTYQEDENGNYIYPYNNQTFKIRVNVKASHDYFDGMGDLAPCIKGSYCPKGYNITLPDGSTWKIINDYDSFFGGETITLISTKYLDTSGNMVEEPFCPIVDLSETDEESISNSLEAFASKIKTSLADDNIIVSLPSAELLGIDFFDPNYRDEYYLPYDDDVIAYDIFNSTFLLSDYFNDYGYSYYWLVDHYKLSFHNSSGYSRPCLIKPVITISKDYLPE